METAQGLDCTVQHLDEQMGRTSAGESNDRAVTRAWKCCFGCLCCRYTMLVRNISGVPALMVFTPLPITRITDLQVSKLGGVSVQVEGSHKVQKFRLLHNKTRKVRVNTYGVYLTVFLRINRQWCTLWSNRQFYANNDVLILQRHIDEAILDLPEQLSSPDMQRQRHAPPPSPAPRVVLRTEV